VPARQRPSLSHLGCRCPQCRGRYASVSARPHRRCRPARPDARGARHARLAATAAAECLSASRAARPASPGRPKPIDAQRRLKDGRRCRRR
jgi:hypothetical protein